MKEEMKKHIGSYGLCKVTSEWFDFVDLVKILDVEHSHANKYNYKVEKLKVIKTNKEAHVIDIYFVDNESIIEFFTKETNPEYFLWDIK